MGTATAGVANMTGIVLMRQQEMGSRNLGRSVITLLDDNLSARARCDWLPRFIKAPLYEVRVVHIRRAYPSEGSGRTTVSLYTSVQRLAS